MHSYWFIRYFFWYLIFDLIFGSNLGSSNFLENLWLPATTTLRVSSQVACRVLQEHFVAHGLPSLAPGLRLLVAFSVALLGEGGLVEFGSAPPPALNPHRQSTRWGAGNFFGGHYDPKISPQFAIFFGSSGEKRLFGGFMCTWPCARAYYSKIVRCSHRRVFCIWNSKKTRSMCLAHYPDTILQIYIF